METSISFSAALRPGTAIRCTRSDYWPKRAGMVGTVLSRKRYAVRLNLDGDVPYHMYLPARKMDLIEETPTTISYRTGKGFTIAWEIVSQPENTS